MSVEAITWALKQPIKQSSTKFVLVIVANCADGKDFVAWPAIPYIASCTGQNEKTVRRGLQALEKDGYIEKTGEMRGATKRTPEYRLNTTKIGSIPEVIHKVIHKKANTPKKGSIESSQNREGLDGKCGHGVPEILPNLGGRTVREPSKEKEDATQPPPEPSVLTEKDLASFGVDRQKARDWLTLRKAKRLPLTPSAWEMHEQEAEKAGMTPAEAVAYAVGANWGGFKASWVLRDRQEEKKRTAGQSGAFLPVSDDDWWSSRAEIERRASEMGLKQKPQEAFHFFKCRVAKAAGAKRWMEEILADLLRTKNDAYAKVHEYFHGAPPLVDSV